MMDGRRMGLLFNQAFWPAIRGGSRTVWRTYDAQARNPDFGDRCAAWALTGQSARAPFAARCAIPPGCPRLGAVVEVLANSASQIQTVVTDAKGSFTIAGLLPGIYTVRVTAPSFLPTIRERVRVQSGANLLH